MNEQIQKRELNAAGGRGGGGEVDMFFRRFLQPHFSNETVSVCFRIFFLSIISCKILEIFKKTG
jgi:hypothetical protein